MTNDGHDGFSTIEILVVLAIVAMLASLLSSRMAPRAPSAPKLAETLADTLGTARSRAIISGKPSSVEIDLSRGAMHDDTGARIEIPPGTEIDVMTAKEAALPGHPNRIVFLADGTSSGGTITIRRVGAVATVETNWLTGLSHVTAEAHR
ncbi:MAG: GspH/FimT family pseudopilin [Rhizobiaceae bacterium]|nr:GspH/FimT family pseudopilin [Rhizobiaceae bacterium]